MKNNYLKLGKIIRNERENRGFSRRKFSALVDISDTELKRIENGERQVPNLITLIKICKILKIDLLNLLEDTDFYEREEDKLYYIIVKSKNTDVFKIHASSETKAAMIIVDFLSENDLIERDENIKNISLFITNDEIFFKETLEDFNEKTEEEIAEKYSNYHQNIDEEYEEDDEEYDEEYEEFCEEFEENCKCFDCEHYCHICNECTLGE
ncbi:helix-turn-helix transcriptional regulator [bacterium]|nr:helix-turn-helix transcriptional regulator [bacterium]